MRRGHSGTGGWRSENHRNFIPRGGGGHHFRPSRPFGPPDAPRFQPPGPRYRGSYPPHSGHIDDRRQTDNHERYRGAGHQPRPPRPQERPHHSRSILPYIQKMRQDNDHNFNNHNYYDEGNKYGVNNMGDVDLRQTPGAPQNRDSFGQRQIAPWANPPFESRTYYNEHRSPHKTPRNQGMNEPMPLNDYTGHRPPASDHYAATPGPNNKNTPYSRSVDDTVDIVRRRIMNRDSQQHNDEPSEPQEMDEDLRMPPSKDYHAPQEQPTRKRNAKHRPNIKSNCDKMKDKIVHQLFKMDKGKIHKLMDNPSSSSKFEYAISSFITESQNSLNRHLRSVAEKSLECNSSDFINNDNNTIYEDTFMKQMQCILDPQDTVLLEDIKPLVLAELSKVLQLDDFQRYEEIEDHSNHPQEDQVEYPYHQENNDQYPNNPFYEADQPEDVENNEGNDFEYNAGTYNNEVFDESKQLFQRRPARHEMTRERLHSTESQQSRRSIERPDKLDRARTPAPVFERAKTPAPVFERVKTPAPVFERAKTPAPVFERAKTPAPVFERAKTPAPIFEIGPTPGPVFERAQTPGPVFERAHTPGPVFERAHTPGPVFERAQTPGPVFERPVFDPNVEQLSEDDDPFAELDKQYHVAVDHNFIECEDAVISLISPSPSKSPPHRENINFSPYTSTVIKKEFDSQLHSMAKSPLKLFSPNSGRDKYQDTKTEARENKRELLSPKKVSEEPKVSEKPDSEVPMGNEQVPSDNSKSSSKPNSRKRSIDQKASHRKEKRKKSSHSESQDPAKSIFNMFFPNTSKESSKTSKKESSEKFVKRKETPKKIIEAESTRSDSHKKQNTSSHSMLSPNDSTSKSDSKTKLTSIDLFTGQPKKGTNVHQAHRNTATPLTVAKSPDENKIKVVPPVPTSLARKLSKRHVATQVVKKYRDKDIQTDKYKNITRGTQTDSHHKTSQSNDPFERMKEIDLEIQVLLQEKFKLYNSLESRSSNGSSTMESLGMTVLNMPVDENDERVSEENVSTTEDDIVDDFTNIPVEELEQIALETVQDKKRPKKRTQESRRRFKSPTSRRTNSNSKTPNISLLEQIITDDRPLEEIISLDDFETTPVRVKSVKSKRKSQKSAPKKKSSKKSHTKHKTTVSEYNPVQENNIKECSVILIRTDLNKLLNQYAQIHAEKTSNEVTSSRDKGTNNALKEVKQSPIEDEVLIKVEQIKEEPIKPEISDSDIPGVIIEENVVENLIPDTEMIVESIVNDLQFDMLDVSEDIVIGDSCEVKEKESEKVETNDGIILDNSHSTIEDVAAESSMTVDECKMYDYSTDENLKRDSMTVSGNADAVLAIECIENDFIAACLDGNVYHFSTDGQLVNTLRGSNLAVTCLTIVKEKCGTTVYTGSLDSRIRYYDLKTGLEKGPECNVLSPIQTMDRAWDTVFVGTRTGFVLQFECKNNMLIPVSTVKFSEQSILALRAMKEGARKVLLVAARSEDVTIKDAQTGLLLRTLVGPKMTVYTLLFEDGKVYCGTSSQRIHVFDYTSGSHLGCHEGGKGTVCLRAAGGLVFAGCYDGCVYVYREGDTRPLAQLRGPSPMLLSLALLGTKIIAGYKDRSLYIWKIPLPILEEMIL